MSVGGKCRHGFVCIWHVLDKSARWSLGITERLKTIRKCDDNAVVLRMMLALSAKASSVSAPSVWNYCHIPADPSTELLSTFEHTLKTELDMVCLRHMVQYKCVLTD